MELRKRLQNIRCEVQKKCNKKTGHNDYAGFDYFQLEDFLPTANEEFNKEGLCPIFTIEYEGERQMAYLTIEDGDEKVVFKTPTAEANLGKNAIQNLGAMLTYTKRYLYLNCLELSEGDAVDATIGKKNPNPTPKSPQKPKEASSEAKDLTNEQLIEEIKRLYTEKEITVLEQMKKQRLVQFDRESLIGYYNHRHKEVPVGLQEIDLQESEKPFY